MCNGVRKSNVSEEKDMFLSHSPEQYQNTWTNPQVHANVLNVLIWWACLLRKLLELKLYLPYLQLYNRNEIVIYHGLFYDIAIKSLKEINSQSPSSEYMQHLWISVTSPLPR